MTNTTNSYHLVHIITGGEHKTPLVASQVFDRAQAQAIIDGVGKPLSVSVWIIVPMSVVIEKESKEIIRTLKKRCPDINIKMIGGIGRLNNCPVCSLLKNNRRKLNGRTIYHCRGESSFVWGYVLKTACPDDAIILDVRGYWPLERYINDSVVKDETDMSASQKEIYYGEVARLRNAIKQSDIVCTVSEPLRDYLIKHDYAGEDTVVLPCAVKNTIPDTKREQVRQALGITDKTAILYLGGTQKGQYLEELVIPFIVSAVLQSDNYIGVFITQDKEKMSAILSKFKIGVEQVRVISVPQNEVGDYLTGMDMGLLLRGPSVQNNFSQPVKFGEYLSAGIPIMLERGTGDVAEKLIENNIGCVIELSNKHKQEDFDKEVKKALDWFEANKNTARTNAKNFVETCYTWKANIGKERNMYIHALEPLPASPKER